MWNSFSSRADEKRSLIYVSCFSFFSPFFFLLRTRQCELTVRNVPRFSFHCRSRERMIAFVSIACVSSTRTTNAATNAAGADRHRHHTISLKKKTKRRERTVRSTATKSIEDRNSRSRCNVNLRVLIRFLKRGEVDSKVTSCSKSSTLLYTPTVILSLFLFLSLSLSLYMCSFSCHQFSSFDSSSYVLILIFVS